MLLNATHILVKHAVIKADLLLKTENVESQKKPTEKTRNRLSGLEASKAIRAAQRDIVDTIHE